MAPSPPLGPLMIDLQGLSLSAVEKEMLSHPATGGVILFSRNYEGPGQIAGLIGSIRSRRPQLLVAVDHEGGRVQRFRDGFTRLPPAARFGERLQSNPAELMQTLNAAGWLMAAELRAVGVDFSFAPVLDVDCGISEIIGDRSFSRDAEKVGDFALAFAQGMGKAGMAAVGKHFPGHGAVALDSHLALPLDHRPLAEIAATDLAPFRQLIGEEIEGIMAAHVIYSQIDEKPAGFSRRWIEDILRRDLNFNGAVFSDDLSMEGAAIFAKHHVDRAALAIEAGCDMVLVCNQPEAVGHVLESMERLNWRDRQPRLNALRGRFPLDRNALLAGNAWREAVTKLNRLNETGE